MNYYHIFQCFLVFLFVIESEQGPSWESLRHCFGASSSAATSTTDRARFSRFFDGNSDRHDGNSIIFIAYQLKSSVGDLNVQ